MLLMLHFKHIFFKNQLDCKRTLSAILIALSFFCVSKCDHIALFDSTVEITQSGLVNVTEKITVKVTGQQIRHGIFRSIPTQYSDDLTSTLGGKKNINLLVKYVLFDEKSVPYEVQNGVNGKIIIIGSASSLVSYGSHTYTIAYSLDRQIGFFHENQKKWTELYFNITGNGWPFYIQKALARIILPPEVQPSSIGYEAYTGYQGDKDKNYAASIGPDNSVIFQTTNYLKPQQGLTVVVTWPQGFVAEPTAFDKMFYFFKDTGWLVWYPLGLFLLLLFYILVYKREKRKLPQKTIIPLFAPPVDLTPGAVRYIYTKQFDNKAFAADIVDMAVHGSVEIAQKDSFWKSAYTLAKKEKVTTDASFKRKYYNALLAQLFETDTSLTITQSYNPIVSKAMSFASSSYSASYGENFNSHIEYQAFGILAAIFIAIMPFWIWDFYQNRLIFIAILLCILVVWGFSKLLSMYTSQGTELMAKIEGFKMYLETAEVERLKVLSTPPQKTPQLYETFLPYAIALGVEDDWSKQFAPMFKQMKAQGHPYIPLWYHGSNFASFNPSAFGSQLSSALSRPISSASRAPGSYSGSSGRGSSGGGGGGGGGGGW